MNIKNLEKITLLTPRLYLKTFQAGYGSFIYEAVMESYELLFPWKIWILNDKDNLKPQDYEKFGMRKIQLLKENKDITFLIFEKDTNKFIGVVSLNQIILEENLGFLGFWIRQSCMGQGYAQEAANCLINFAFNELKFSQIKAVHGNGNIQSEKTLLKLGFELVKSHSDNFDDAWINYIKLNF